MAFDYDDFYKQNPKDSLWEPFPEFVNFFQYNNLVNSIVLDLWAWQWRDSVFIARLWNKVDAVDISKTWIDQLNSYASNNNLQIKWIVSDILEYIPANNYDIIVIDRTLHMLLDHDKILKVLWNIVWFVNNNWYILIADEKKNIWFIKDFLVNSWFEVVFDKKWFLFTKKI